MKISTKTRKIQNLIAVALMILTFFVLAYTEYFIVYDSVNWRSITALFTIITVLLVIFAITTLTKRLLFSTIMGFLLIVLIVGSSVAKFNMMGQLAHSYDIIFYLSSPGILRYLIESFPAYVFAFAGFSFLILISGVYVFRKDRTNFSRSTSLFLVACCGFAMLCIGKDGFVSKYRTAYDQAYVGMFVGSVPTTFRIINKGGLLDAAPAPADKLFALNEACSPSVDTPNIIFIHQESAMQPWMYNGLEFDPSLTQFFQSQDGSIKPLQVEIFGGGSQVTIFSAMAGVSAMSFGEMSYFTTSITADNIAEALPSVLKNCGYDTLLFNSFEKNYLGLERFFNSVGFDQQSDFRDMGISTYHARDRVYYDYVMDDVFFEEKGKPKFIYIQNMMMHSPYANILEEQESTPAPSPKNTAGVNEYLRRMAISMKDINYFKSELSKRFPDQRFLFVQYGDHQPPHIRHLLQSPSNYAKSLSPASSPNVVANLDSVEVGIGYFDSARFLTYFSLSGVNYQVPSFEIPAPVHVAYLPNITLKAASLPLPESFRAREDLMLLCNGRYFTCPVRDEVLKFHRRLLDSGAILKYTGNEKNDKLNKQSDKNDTQANITLTGDDSDNKLSGGNGADTLNGGNGNDSINGRRGADVIEGGPGADFINGGGEFDYASYFGAKAGVRIDMLSPQTGTGDGAGDTFKSIEGIQGSQFDDIISGDGSMNYLFGNDGNDVFYPRGGNDFVYGGNGGDVFYKAAQDGDDTFADFVTGDLIQLQISGANGLGPEFNSFEKIMAASKQKGADTILILGEGASLTLKNVQRSTLTQRDFALI